MARSTPRFRRRGCPLWLAWLCCAPVLAQVQTSPLATVNNGRTAPNNDQIVTTGIRSPALPSNHALIISVSGYPRSPLPGVLKDRAIATELAARFGVPQENISYLSEQAVTREGLQQALDRLGPKILPGDRLYIYFSGHGARFLNKQTGQCTESLVMQNLTVVTNDEFADMVKPLSARSDKTVVMLDACHAGGVAEVTGSRDALQALHRPRAKFDADASSAECATPVNLRGFDNARGIDFDTTDNNLVVLAAARKNEVAWDTDQGGAMTYGFLQCVAGGAVDKDRSGSISMQELTDCVQQHLDHDEEDSIRQHLTLSGNSALVPGFSTLAPVPPTPPAPVPAPAPVAANALAALRGLYSQRDDRWDVAVQLNRPTLRIGTDALDFTIHSARDGFVYIFYLGTQPGSFYLLFPNQLDDQNLIKANEALRLPRPSWTVNALGPSGTDHLLVMVTEAPRALGDYALPSQYFSLSGPFGKIAPTVQSAVHLNEVATLAASGQSPECQDGAHRDLGVARHCSNVFGAALVSVDEQ
jgi:hypothetical protein